MILQNQWNAKTLKNNGFFRINDMKKRKKPMILQNHENVKKFYLPLSKNKG